MNSTRLMPPWFPEDHVGQTFLQKTVTARFEFVSAPPPGDLNVGYAREVLYIVPSNIWTQQG